MQSKPVPSGVLTVLIAHGRQLLDIFLCALPHIVQGLFREKHVKRKSELVCWTW